MNLPPLPEPALINEIRYSGIAVNKMVSESLYTEAQMLALQRETVEACASVAETAANKLGGHQFAADAIRRMK